MHKNTLTGLLVFAVGIGVLALFLLWFLKAGPYLNDLSFERFSRPFFSMQEPTDAERIAQFKSFGQEVGSGDHCDYLVAIALQTNLSTSTLAAHYSDVYSGESKIEVVSLHDPNEYTSPVHSYSALPSLKEWILTGLPDNSVDAIIYTYESHVSVWPEYRCGI
jgi:hypothetical protein